ncbi:MAG TPA: Gfo/Idh/MocA family oxidoreductase [Flavitalea sp.]|nr:Gfo/Idh/MocA family oxidoreductase [Flavitalea sp.]
MAKDYSSSRRKFIRQLGNTTLLLTAGSLDALAKEEVVEKRILHYENKISKNDTIRIGCIGMGIMGFNNVETAVKVPGVEFVAACDLYDGRLQKAKEVYGQQVFTTRSYQELLERKDIDAVIIATSDHWHDHISIAAMRKGKAVYCEKPMVHHLNEGLAVIQTQKETKRVFQVGSQRVSSIAFAEAKKQYRSGVLGQLNCIEATYDRHSALGAWQYSIPPDANEQTVDWNRYVGDAPKRSYDPNHFFRWRNYRAYGTGVAGDLFVHLISGIHFITGSLGPSRIFTSGALSYWKDGRDVPDVMVGILDYPATKEHPAFQVTLRVNFSSGQGENSVTKLYGSNGVMDMSGDGFVIRQEKLPKAPGYGGWDSYNTFPEATQKAFVAQYEKKYSAEDQKVEKVTDISYQPPEGYNEHLDHHINFFESVRAGKPVVEDAVFGFRAAGPCLACNESYFQKKVINWDPVNMKVKV